MRGTHHLLCSKTHHLNEETPDKPKLKNILQSDRSLKYVKVKKNKG